MKRKQIPLLIFTLLVMKMGFSQQKNFIDQSYLEVTAMADTLVTPDEIYMDILITEKDTKGKTSVEDLEQQMVQTLEKLGINTKTQLKLSDLASNFKKYFLSGQDVLKSKTYQLKVNDAVMAGKVLLALEKQDIANVNVDRAEYSKLKDLEITMLSRAVKMAHKQATAMANPLNQKIGKALFISEMNYGRPMMAEARTFNAMSLKSDKVAQIDFEKIRVEKTVMVRFVLE